MSTGKKTAKNTGGAEKGDGPENGDTTVALPVSVVLKILASAGYTRHLTARHAEEIKAAVRDFAEFCTRPIAPLPDVMSSLYKYPRGTGLYGFAFMDGTIMREVGDNPAVDLLYKYRAQQTGVPAQFLFARIVDLVHAILRKDGAKGTLFTFGKATCGKTPGKSGKTPYVRNGMVSRWGGKYGPAGYKGIICLAMFDREEPMRKCHYDDPEAESITLENLLHREFADDKTEHHECYHDGLSNSQSGSLSQREHDDYYAVTYLAFGGKYDPAKKANAAQTTDPGGGSGSGSGSGGKDGGPAKRTRSTRRKDNIRNPAPNNRKGKGRAKNTNKQ